MKKLNICFLPSDKGGVYHFRVATVAKWLEKLDLARTRILEGGEMWGVGDLMWADVIVSQRKGEREVYDGVLVQSRALIAQLKQEWPNFKKLFVYDTDDWIHGIPSTNPASEYYKIGSERCDTSMLWIKNCDSLSVSTSKLKNRYQNCNSNIMINPNFIDEDTWEIPFMFNRPKELKDEIRIGFCGSNTHYADSAMIKGDLKAIIKKFPNVKLVIQGVRRDKHDKNDLRDLFSDLGDRVEYHEGIELRNYATKLKSLHLDIGLAPLIDDNFNQCKSAIKFYEYSMLDVPTVCSKIGEYPEACPDNCAVLTDKNDWFKNLSKLIRDKELRQQIGQCAGKYVREFKSGEQIAPIWYKNYFEAWSKL